MRLIDVFQLLDLRVTIFINLNHVLALHTLIHERGNEKNRLVYLTDIFYGLELLDIE
jgi:hypothetical protein